MLSEAAGIREPNWLGDETVLALRDGGEGRTEMVVGNVFGFRERLVSAKSLFFFWC